MKAMLDYDPARRITATQALLHPWLSRFTHVGAELLPKTFNIWSQEEHDNFIQSFLYQAEFPAGLPILQSTYLFCLVLLLKQKGITVDQRIMRLLASITKAVLDETTVPQSLVGTTNQAQLLDAIFQAIGFSIFLVF